MSFSKSRLWDAQRDMPSLVGKVAIVSGGNSGLGRESVMHLASHGAKVYMTARDEDKAKAAVEELEKEVKLIVAKGEENGTLSEGKIEFLKLDMCDLKGCINAAKEFMNKEDRLDILVDNAGIMASPYGLTKDGFEVQFQTNYLGHFAFTIPLLPIIVRTSRLQSEKSSETVGARIVQVSSLTQDYAYLVKEPVPSSGGERKGFAFVSREDVNREFEGMLLAPWKRYCQSKLCNILFARELDKRLKKERIWSNAVNPGSVRTGLHRGVIESFPMARLISWIRYVFFKTSYEGAIPQLYAATAKEIEEKDIRAEYIQSEPGLEVGRACELAYDDTLAEELWEFSIKMVKEATGEDVDYKGDLE